MLLLTCNKDPPICNHCHQEVVGSNPTKLTADFKITKVYKYCHVILNHKLICAILKKIIDINYQCLYEREMAVVASLYFISPCGSLPSSLHGKIIEGNLQGYNFATLWPTEEE